MLRIHPTHRPGPSRHQAASGQVRRVRRWRRAGRVAATGGELQLSSMACRGIVRRPGQDVPAHRVGQVRPLPRSRTRLPAYLLLRRGWRHGRQSVRRHILPEILPHQRVKLEHRQLDIFECSFFAAKMATGQ